MAMAVTSIIGEKMMMAQTAPTRSTVRFTNALNVLVRGTWRILTTGSPIKSSVYGRVGMILL